MSLPDLSERHFLIHEKWQWKNQLTLEYKYLQVQKVPF